ncbi:MAG TPA: hypothetical protein VFA84_08365 [Acidimicrobiales bacterium]|nr:hypothetical protein [Acidimicrobiales bacterium]
MEVIHSGDEAAVRRSLRAFIAEMEVLGEGYASGDDDDFEPEVLHRGDGVMFISDDAHVVLILSGSAWFTATDGGRVHVGPTQGVFCDAGERWRVEVDDNPVLYVGVEGTALSARTATARATR